MLFAALQAIFPKSICFGMVDHPLDLTAAWLLTAVPGADSRHWPQGAGVVALLMDDLLLTVVEQEKPVVFDYTPGSVASVTEMVNEVGWNKQVY